MDYVGGRFPNLEQETLRMSDEKQEVTVVQHLCPACEDDFSEARAHVIKALGISIAFTPPLLLCLAFAASMAGKPLIVDDRIMIGCLTAWATIIAYAFKRGWNI